MHQFKSVTAWVTLCAFLTSSAPEVAFAQTTTSTIATGTASSSLAVPNYAIAQLTGLAATSNGVNGQINACDLRFPAAGSTSIAGALTGALAGASPSPSAKGSQGSCYQPNLNFSGAASTSTSTTTKNKSSFLSALKSNTTSKTTTVGATSCNLDCQPPSELQDPDVNQYCTKLDDSGSAYSNCLQRLKSAGVKDTTACVGSLVGGDKNDQYQYKFDLHSTLSTPAGMDNSVIRNSDNQVSLVDETKQRINEYIAYKNYQANVCEGQTLDQVKAQYANYQCKTQALSNAVSSASSQLQAALTANQQSYQKQIQFSKQVSSQIDQVDKILNGDKGDSTGGLLGIQKQMTTELQNWAVEGGKLQTQVTDITTRTTANDQTLESDRLGQVDQCMEGNAGGGSYVCWKRVPTAGASGSTSGASSSATTTYVTKSDGSYQYVKGQCGGLEYIRSQIEMSAYQTGGGTQSNTGRANDYAGRFNSIMSIMQGDLGAYDSVAGSDGKASGEKLAPLSDVATASQFLSKYMGQLSALPGFNNSVASAFSQMVNTCYSRSQTWKSQQLKSAGSKYNKEKTAISTEKNDVNSTLSKEFISMNQMYGTAMGFLTNGAGVNINMQSCTTDDPTQMMSCYNTIKSGMTNILNGSGTVGVSTKTIVGGSLVANFNVSCQGINKCVTAYQQIKQDKQTQVTTAAKQREDFVSNSNAVIQNQLQSFAQQLQSYQQQVSSQFSNMQGSLSTLLGTSLKSQMGYVQGEQLKTSGGGQSGETGPYDSPRNMMAVLSGLVQPTGLVDFSKDGGAQLIQEATDAVSKAKDKIAKDVETYQGAIAKLDRATSQCSNVPAKKDLIPTPVATSSDKSQSCMDVIDACKNLPTTGTVGSTLSGIITSFQQGNLASDQANKLSDALDAASLNDPVCDYDPNTTDCGKYLTGVAKSDTTSTSGGNAGHTGAAQ